MDYSSLVPLANKTAKKKKDEFTMIEPEQKMDSGKLPAIAKNKDMFKNGDS